MRSSGSSASLQTELTAARSDLTAGARERQGLQASRHQELQQLQGALSRQDVSSRAVQVGGAAHCQQHHGGTACVCKGGTVLSDMRVCHLKASVHLSCAATLSEACGSKRRGLAPHLGSSEHNPKCCQAAQKQAKHVLAVVWSAESGVPAACSTNSLQYCVRGPAQPPAPPVL